MKKHVSIGIMLTLLSGKRVTASFLAEKYETSVKTIYRSIDTLLEAGMPIKCLQGKNGGYEIIKESSISSSFFTTKELCAFISFLKSTRSNIDIHSFTLEDRLSSLSDKSLAQELEKESKTMVIDTNIWGHIDRENKKSDIIKNAINKNLKILIKYLNKNINKTESRVINPYTLVYKTNMWYVYAYCEKRKEFRLFKLSRICSLEILTDHFEKQNIDTLSKPWNTSFKANSEEINITLQCYYCDLNDIKEWLENCNVKQDSNNKFTLTGKALFSLGLVHKIMEYGNRIKIVSPTKLKDAVITECYNIYNSYAEEKTHLC